VGSGRTACSECQRLTASTPAAPALDPPAAGGRRLRVVS